MQWNSEPTRPSSVYFLSGLGLNERIFHRLNLPGCHPTFIPWLEPHSRESISHYALRIGRIIASDSTPTLVGLSFGGIVAIEIAKQMDVKKVILISSIKSYQERPLYMKAFSYLPAYRVLDHSVYEATIGIWGRFFGIHSPAEQKNFLSMFARMSGKYISWAIDQILEWDNTTIPTSVVHIHGDRDRVFPIQRIVDPCVIHGGDHGMVVIHAKAVSQALLSALSSRTP